MPSQTRVIPAPPEPRTNARINGRAARYTLTAPFRKHLQMRAMEANSASTRATRLLINRDTAETDSIVEHLEDMLVLCRRAIDALKTDQHETSIICQQLGDLERDQVA